MKLSRTVGLAVAISLLAATVAVSLVKPLPRTEQFEKRAYAVPPSLSETAHGPWHEMSNGHLSLEKIQQRGR
jgi:hypothetical protein